MHGNHWVLAALWRPVRGRVTVYVGLLVDIAGLHNMKVYRQVMSW